MRRGGTMSWMTLIVIIVAVVAWAWWDMSNGGGDTAEAPATPPAASPTPTPQPSPTSNPKPTTPGGSTTPTTPGSKWPTIPADAQRFTVAHVHDGDTVFLESSGGGQVSVRDRIKVRLIGIDSPEVSEPMECYAKQASAELRDLMPNGSTVYGTTDVEPQDHYDRWLLYLWTEDGFFINASMVDNGYAEAIRVRPNDSHWDLLRTLEASAERDRIGMWGAC